MDNIIDTYNFSDDFMDILNQVSTNNQPADVSQSNTEEKPDSEPDDDNDEWQKKYDDLQNENNSLRQQLNEFPLNNPEIQSDDFLSNYYSENQGKSGLLNMVLNDDVEERKKAYEEDIRNFQTKSSKVNVEDEDPALVQYMNTLPTEIKKKIVITSGNDQEHAKGSLHYQGKALDLRYFPEVHSYIKNDPIAQRMGIKVLNPNHGTAPHTHIEKREFGGGESQPAGLWSTNRKQWVDSVNNANMDKNFVKRFYGQNNPTIQVSGYPSRSTHLMGWDGNLTVAPQVVMMQDGKLHYLPTEDARDEYAQKTGEFIKFQTPQQAEWYANNGYKLGTGVLNSINKGKPYNNPKYKVQ